MWHVCCMVYSMRGWDWLRRGSRRWVWWKEELWWGTIILTAGITLALFGGVRKHPMDQNNVPVRGDIHVIIVGMLNVFCLPSKRNQTFRFFILFTKKWIYLSKMLLQFKVGITETR